VHNYLHFINEQNSLRDNIYAPDGVDKALSGAEQQFFEIFRMK